MRTALVLALAIAGSAGCGTLQVSGSGRSEATASPGAAHPAGAKLHALFDEAWEADLRRFPEFGTYVGDNRFGDRLTDATARVDAEAYAEGREQLERARAIDPLTLNGKDRTSRDLFIYELQSELMFEPMLGWRRMSGLQADRGFQNQFADLLRASPVETRAQVEQVLARMAVYPHRVDQETVRLREGQSLGWVASRPVIARALATLDIQLEARGDESPFFEPFTRLSRAIPEAQRAELRERARQLIAEKVLPAQRMLRDFVAGPYVAAAPGAGNLSLYPGGAGVYAARVRAMTTTDLSPAQIHAIGLREVARLRGELDKVMREMGWSGDFASFAQHMNTDPKYFHPNADSLVASYREIGKRIDPELPRLFTQLPRSPWGVRAMPAAAGPDAAEYYNGPSLDGSRPGWINVNAVGYRNRPKWGEETLAAHEGVPGHHLQFARATELGDLPKFRRAGGYVAFGEGWALYAETLGFDLGLYKDPASRYGYLQAQIWRATRLVVDTGLHDGGWSRDSAIDYMAGQTGMARGTMEAEVDRYLGRPAQALGYMVGELKIIELRDRAREKLGDRFDIRRFHSAVLDQGSVPLPVLERQVDDWITAELAAR